MQLELFEENCGGIGLDELFQAYYDCRKNKRKTFNALEFEADYENRLLEADFISDSYSCREEKGSMFLQSLRISGSRVRLSGLSPVLQGTRSSVKWKKSECVPILSALEMEYPGSMSN